MKRLLDVSVSILVVIALFMSQSWAVTAAYADYSIDGSFDCMVNVAFLSFKCLYGSAVI